MIYNKEYYSFKRNIIFLIYLQYSTKIYKYKFEIEFRFSLRNHSLSFLL